MKIKKVKSAPLIRKALRILDYQFVEQTTSQDKSLTGVGMKKKICNTVFLAPNGKTCFYISNRKIETASKSTAPLVSRYVEMLKESATQVT